MSVFNSFNILISSSGKQSLLVEAFKNALHDKGLVFAIDYNKYAPALAVADQSFIAPAFTSENYIEWMLDICKKNKIKLVLSLNVDELIILEQHRNEFERINCTLIGGPLDTIYMSVDKLKLNHFLYSNGFPSLKLLSLDEVKQNRIREFPVICKPRFGKASIGVKFINYKSELEDLIAQLDKKKSKSECIFQEISQGTEYGFDIVNDLNGNFAAALVRRKYAMKNGETDVAETIEPSQFIDFARKLSTHIKHQGSIDIDCFLYNNKIYVIDMNYRFGGGYVYCHYAGANTPQAIVNWAIGKTINENDLKYKSGLLFSRTSKLIQLK